MDVGAESLRRWVMQSQVDAGQKGGPSTNEDEDLKQPRAEVRDLKEANDSLKAGSVFLSSRNSTLATADLPVH